MLTRTLDPLGVILGVRHAALVLLVLARVGRLVLEGLDEAVEAGGDGGTEEGAEPVDPVVALKGARHNARGEGSGRVERATGIVDT